MIIRIEKQFSHSFGFSFVLGFVIIDFKTVGFAHDFYHFFDMLYGDDLLGINNDFIEQFDNPRFNIGHQLLQKELIGKI
jgi:hypothetical protein